MLEQILRITASQPESLIIAAGTVLHLRGANHGLKVIALGAVVYLSVTAIEVLGPTMVG